MPKDFLGRDILVGDTVVYPNRAGSRMYMLTGRIEAIDGFGNLRVRKSNGNVVHVRALRRVVVVESPDTDIAIPNTTASRLRQGLASYGDAVEFLYDGAFQPSNEAEKKHGFRTMPEYDGLKALAARRIAQEAGLAA